MTEEQNKLAERLDQLRNQLVMNRGLHIDDHQSFCAHLGEIIAALRREPATDAVRDQAVFEKWWAEQEAFTLSFACKGTAWNAWQAALKGKGASQGDMVMVPREPTDAMMEAAKPAFATIDAWCAEMQLVRGRKPDWPESDPPLRQAWRLMLSAASPMSRRDEDAKR